ncbi:Cobalt-zinc-cadmium resistance protein [hydrothermal vent metagenome]|uniref:Cobalt-zinc-cadmium resistance protein n=1 Tax=hydrothermal vent metagenome TaxID=652676 RepID=A0A3B1BZ66_9ZZZZ
MSEHSPLIKSKYCPERLGEASRVTVIGAVVNLVLAMAKFVAGVLGSSAAMMADAVHSLSDLATDAIVYISMRIASHEADEDHPYGHGRAETIGSAILGVALLAAGIFIIFEVIDHLLTGELAIPTWPAIAGAIVSIISKETLYYYTLRAGVRLHSDALVANAWHHRTDSISSVAALIGIGGAMMGFPILDSLAAIVVVFMIVKVGGEITWNAFQDLMDRSAPPERLKDFKNVILSTKGVKRYHELRARKVGVDLFVDVHILVQPNISVSEAHNIAETVRANLKEKAGATDALVHIDAEEDMDYRLMLVDREKVEAKLNEETKRIDGIKGVSDVTIHYLRGKMLVEFIVDTDDSLTMGEAKKRTRDLRRRLLEDDMFHEVVINGRLTEKLSENNFINQKSVTPKP